MLTILLLTLSLAAFAALVHTSSLENGLVVLQINTTQNQVAVTNNDPSRAAVFNVFDAATGTQIVWSYTQPPNSSATIAIPTRDNNNNPIDWQVGMVTTAGADDREPALAGNDAMMRTPWLCTAFILAFCSSGFAAIAHVAGCSVTGHFNAASNSETFTCTPNAGSDAIVFKVTCGDSGTVTAISLTASGWTITALSGVTGSSTAGWGATFGAIALGATSTTFTATFTGASTCSSYEDYAADEFSGNDTTGGITTFDAHNQATGTGSCSVSVTPANNNDAVWGACEDSTTAVGSGYTKGEDDAGGDWTEYKILAGGSGVAQTVNFTGSGAYNALAVTIKPAGGAAAPAGIDKRRKLEKLDALY